MEISFPWPPSVNTYYRNVRGKTLISKDGRAYAVKVAHMVKASNQQFKIPYRGYLAVQIVAYPPDRRRRDADNLLKGVLDAMEKAGVYIDDSQVKDLRVVMRSKRAPGHIEVTVSELDDWPHDGG